MAPGAYWRPGEPAFFAEKFHIVGIETATWKVYGPTGEVTHVADESKAQWVCGLLNQAHEEGIKAGRYLAATKRSEALKEALKQAKEKGRVGGRKKE